MTHEGLEVVYQMGDERRKAYYKQQVDGIDGDELTCLYEVIAWLRSGTPFNKKLVLDSLGGWHYVLCSDPVYARLNALRV